MVGIAVETKGFRVIKFKESLKPVAKVMGCHFGFGG
jgi:hypothetical protein